MDKLPNRARAFLSRCIANKHFNGWCDEKKSSAMMENVFESKPKTYVEIGVFAGRSLISVALAQAINNTPGAKAYGIDPWKPAESIKHWDEGDPNHKWWGSLDHDAIYWECVDYVELLSLNGIVELIRDTSAGALDQIKRVGRIDLLHIDGNHSEEQALFDVENYVPLVRPNGYVWFDDVNWDTTRTAQIKITEFCDPIGTVTGEAGVCGLYRKR